MQKLDGEKKNFEEQKKYWQDKENEYNAQLAKSNIEQVKQVIL